MRFRLSRVGPLLFFSGASALVYQVAWLRELRLVFGASTAASAAVLGVFMGGLGLGGILLGKRADKVPNPLLFYANLEIAVAVAAAVTPLLVWLARTLYLALGGQSTLGMAGATVARLVLGALVLIVPTTLMGGTMPAAARAVSHEGDPGRRSMSALYGINTLGAVVGALAANFVMLEVFGTRLSLWMTCLLNVLVGLVGRMLSRDPVAEPVREAAPARTVVPEAAEAAAPEPEPAAELEAEAPAKDSGESGVSPEKTPPSSARPATTAKDEPSQEVLPASLAWFPVAAAGVVGFAFLLMELVWYRMLAPLLGGSSYTFGLILAVALLGIGVGGAIYGFGKTVPTLRGFALTCGLEALLIAIPYAAGDRIALLALGLRPLRVLGFGGSIASWALVCLVVIFPAAVVSGAQFPLVIGLFGRGGKDLGKHIGVAYLANTVGAIVGSLSGGFGLMPALTAPGCWKLVVALLAGFGMVSLFLSARHEERRGPVYVGGLATSLLAFATFFAEGPTPAWRHSPIGAGRMDPLAANPSANEVERFRHDARSSILWERDGLESTVAAGRKFGTSFIVNGKTDGNSIGDAPTQIMSGLLGSLLHPSPKRALVVGLGTGSTAGWLGKVAGMERVDAVELEPAVIEVARECSPINEKVLENPKVHVILGDAREVLLTSRERYDIVFSEPSNPYRAGVSSLYTQEYYRAAKTALGEQGIFIQWMQGYEVDADALHTVLTTVRSVFGSVELWETMPGDFLVLARSSPVASIDVAAMTDRLAQEPYKTAVKYVWGGASPEVVLSHFVATDDFAKRLVDNHVGFVNKDDLNRLEFSYARTVGEQGTLADETIRLSRALGTDRPAVSAKVRWDRVDASWVLFRMMNDVPAPFPRPLDPSRADEEQGLRKAYAGFLGGPGLEVVRAFQQAKVPEPTYFETLELARAAARSSLDAKVVEVAVGPLDPGTAKLLLAERVARTGDDKSAVALLVEGFGLARASVWVDKRALLQALALAREIVGRSTWAADPLLAALETPFVLHMEDMARHRVAIWLSSRAQNATCAAVSGDPRGFPWEQKALEERVACLTRVGSPALPAAQADLGRFVRQAPTPVGGR
ncbi:MAG: fused MFS/spermidine synthase [Myxococcales bacterium]|nr:fused MFS/spermidine synthase [Myxococcales bacterium]